MDHLRYKTMYGYLRQPSSTEGDDIAKGGDMVKPEVLAKPETTELGQTESDLTKAGEGSRGGRIVGHTKSGKPIYEGAAERKPYPGEESHNVKTPSAPKPKTFLPPEGTAPHFTDTPNKRAYKNLIRYCKQKGMDFMGHVTYNPKNDSVLTTSSAGASMVKEIIATHEAKQAGLPALVNRLAPNQLSKEL